MKEDRKINVGGKLYNPDELVGRTMSREHFWDRTVLFLGNSKYFFRDTIGESVADIEDLRDTRMDWKLKPKTKTVKVERWIAVYRDGSIYAYYTKKGADDCGSNRIAVEHLVREYEIEVEE